MKALLVGCHESQVFSEVSHELVERWRIDTEQLLWIDLDGKRPEDTQFLQNEFGLNDLALLDSCRDRHPPKFESFETHFFTLLRSAEIDHSAAEVCYSQLSIFVGDRYIVTRRQGAVGVLDKLWAQYSNAKGLPDLSASQILYRLFRPILDEYIEKIISIEQRLEYIEDALDDDEQDIYLPELISFNTSLRKLSRNLGYLKQVAERLRTDTRTNHKYMHEFTDIYEQAERGYSLAKMYQELCTDLINAHISISSHRVNKVVKILTIFTVLFVPLGFIAGLYGMNFEYMPELTFKYGYFYVLGLMVAIEILLVVLLRKLKWL